MSILKWAVIFLAVLSYTLALGTQTPIENYPSVVQVEHYSGGFWLQQCVGSIVTKYHVLTAASCLRIALRNYRVRAGSSVRGVGGFTTDIRHVIHHPSNNFRGDVGDIGLIRVRWELSLGPTIAQTHFMPEGFLLPHNVPLLIVGWGSTTGGTVINDNLYSLLLQTKKFDACEKAYKTFPGTRPGNVSTHMICTGLSTSGGRDFDAIDTGAPLFFGNTVVGVASFGVSKGNDEMPIVATEISYYTGWIITTAV
ncbi:unnamed protein product [Arctia plantaginis]|uniref:Peptidase S1 domain-containing protein n=1 Tax=Arctia plantaginis TaxID=874455 RepID=A0A8S0ZUN1_ARCPL|nr:unnamed protein product [Arctia plantaginis]